MRHLPLLFILLASPAAAWEFVDAPICTLTHRDAEAEVVVTFDPSLPEYAIAVTLTQGTWPVGPVFAITFDGPIPLTIQTDRHILSDDGRTITVRDTGFANVLDGLELNGIAVAFLGTTAAHKSLEGAAPAVRAFRACPATVTSSHRDCSACLGPPANLPVLNWWTLGEKVRTPSLIHWRAGKAN
jgi:hypothetical protein